MTRLLALGHVEPARIKCIKDKIAQKYDEYSTNLDDDVHKKISLFIYFWSFCEAEWGYYFIVSVVQIRFHVIHACSDEDASGRLY